MRTNNQSYRLIIISLIGPRGLSTCSEPRRPTRTEGLPKEGVQGDGSCLMSTLSRYLQHKSTIK